MATLHGTSASAHTLSPRMVGFTTTLALAGAASAFAGALARAGRLPLPNPAWLALVVGGVVYAFIGLALLIVLPRERSSSEVLVGHVASRTALAALLLSAVQTLALAARVILDSLAGSGWELVGNVGVAAHAMRATGLYFWMTSAILFFLVMGLAAKPWTLGRGTRSPKRVARMWTGLALFLTALPWLYARFA